MTEHCLVDTSAWILSFRKAGSLALKEFLKECLALGLVMTCPIVILELLQGCRTENERDALKSQLESLDVCPITSTTWDKTYLLGFSLARKGIILPTNDLIIASVAMENNATLLHQDQHYEILAKHSQLKTKRF